MTTPPTSPFLRALPEGLCGPEQLPVIFHTMGEHNVMTAHLPMGESRPHRMRMFTPEPAPKPTSRCFPG